MPAWPDPEASVIIPAHNTGAWIGRQLKALISQEAAPPFEVLVCDNNSTDGTADRARAYLGRLDLRVVDASGPASASHARNVGAQHARSPLLLFCDSDDLVEPEWVEAMVTAMRAAPNCIVSGQNLLEPVNPPHLIEAYDYGPDPEGARNPRDDVPFVGDLAPFRGFLPSTTGSNFACPRDAYLRVGGMDTSYPGGSEDTDLAWRVQLDGLGAVMAPRARVNYRLRTSGRSIFRQQRIQQYAQVLLWTRFPESAGPSFKASALGAVRYGVAALAAPLTGRSRLKMLRYLGGHIGALQGIMQYRVLKRAPRSTVEGPLPSLAP